MSTWNNTNAMAATCATELMRSGFIAPPAVHVPGSESAYRSLGSPMFGTDITSVTRVRDAKQAAPPRGELH